MLQRPLVLGATLLFAAVVAPTTSATEPSINPSAAISSPPETGALPSPRPALKTPKRGVFPFVPWSYAKAYTFNFFAEQAVPMRVVSKDGSWSPHIRSQQLIPDHQARRAAALVARTQGSIETTKCTFPRHAVVYFDQNDKPVASTDVCFECEAVLAWPDYERPESFDYEKMARRLERVLPQWRKLFEKDFGLPIDYKANSPMP